MEHLSQFIMNHWLLWAGLIVVLALTLLNELFMKKKNAKQLTPEAVVDMMNNENAIVVDIRDKETFKSGHIIEAINVSPDEFDKPKMTQLKNKNIILVCARGQQSPAAAETLRAQGFQPLVLGGGIAAWQTADLPLVKGKG